MPQPRESSACPVCRTRLPTPRQNDDIMLGQEATLALLAYTSLSRALRIACVDVVSTKLMHQRCMTKDDRAQQRTCMQEGERSKRERKGSRCGWHVLTRSLQALEVQCTAQALTKFCMHWARAPPQLTCTIREERRKLRLDCIGPIGVALPQTPRCCKTGRQDL